ncbi:CMTR2.2 family protein [Megaselia abdita]
MDSNSRNLSNSQRRDQSNWKTTNWRDQNYMQQKQQVNWRVKTIHFEEIRNFHENRIPQSEIDSYFQMKRKYSKQADWTLPDISRAYSSDLYEIETFEKIREDLRNLKYGEVKKNFKDSQIVKKYGIVDFIVRFLKSIKKVDFVVRDWTKAYEIFSEFPLVQSGTLNSIHIENRSGGFITALNHFLHSHFEDVKWNWKAFTDNPYYEGRISTNRMDDRLISNTYDNWCFGADYTGELIDQANIDLFLEKCYEMGEIHLAIAAFSKELRTDFKNKELHLFESHFAGLVTALKALSNGGSLVFCTYSLYRSVNISLMYFLNLVFEEVHICKPACASIVVFEHYVIGLRFKKDANVQKYLEEMKASICFNSWEKGPLFLKDDIPNTFLKQHQEIMKYFEDIYSKKISDFRFYQDNPEDQRTKRWETLIRLMPKNFCERFEVQEIEMENRLVKNQHKIHITPNSNTTKQSVDYVFNTNEELKVSLESFDILDEYEYHEELRLIFEKVKNTEDLLRWPYKTDMKTFSDFNSIDLAIEFGKPIEKVQNTMFITPSILYGFVAKIEEKYDLFVVEHFPEEEISCIFDDSTVINYKFKKDYSHSERDFMNNVFDKWIALEPNRVEFRNVLFITHFAASFLRILVSFYDQVSINSKGTFLVEHLKEDISNSKLIEDLGKRLKASSCDRIMCLVEPKHVNKSEFFEILTNYNSQLLINYINKIFEFWQ